MTLPDSRFLLVDKRMAYTQCQFLDAGVLTATQIPTLPAPRSSSANSLASDLFFTVNTPTGQVIYKRAFEYTPAGLVYNGLNPVYFLEFGLQPAATPATTVTSRNVACFRLPFITGRSQLYRP